MFREVVFEDPDNQPDEGNFVEFRLTYEGPLLATQRDPRPAEPYKTQQRENRHAIRRAVHRQLKRLWEITPFLKTGERSGPGIVLLEGPNPPVYRADVLAARYAMFGFNFVPLVTKELDLLCGLDVLFLRPDRPGDVVWRGDIDNRIKTLIDALKIPEANENYADRSPADDERPMYCLLADDKLVTKLVVETDQLLDVESEREGRVKLIITVRLRPYEIQIGNMQFG